jgi:DNA-binding transcriptional ArsR family regulator
MQKPFEGMFGNSCELRVIEFMLPLEGLEYNLTELQEEMGVTRQTLSKVMKNFEEWGLVKARTAGNAAYYSINEKSPLVKSIIQLNNVIIEKMLGDEELYELRDYLDAHSALKADVNVIASQPINSSESEDMSPWPKFRVWGPDPIPTKNQFAEPTSSSERPASSNEGGA